MFYKLKGISSFSQESRTESGCKSGRISYVIVQIRDGGLYRDFKVRVLFEKACRRRAFLMHKGFVILVKSDVEYLN